MPSRACPASSRPETERVEVDPTGFKETIRIETIQVWLGEANEEGTEIAKDLGYWKFKSKLGE